MTDGVLIKLTVEEIDEGFKLFEQVSSPENDFAGLRTYLAWIDMKICKIISTDIDKIKKMDFDFVNDIRRDIHKKVVSKIDFLKSSLK